MTVDDLKLLIKKILVGIIVTIIPFVILVGGLHYLRSVLTKTSIEQAVQIKNKRQVK